MQQNTQGGLVEVTCTTLFLFPLQVCCPSVPAVQSSSVEPSPLPGCAQYTRVIPGDESLDVMPTESPTAHSRATQFAQKLVVCDLSPKRNPVVWAVISSMAALYSGQAPPFYQCHLRSMRYDARSSVAKTRVLVFSVVLVAASAFEKRTVALCVSSI